jgi:pilus assembly protein CpaF
MSSFLQRKLNEQPGGNKAEADSAASAPAAPPRPPSGVSQQYHPTKSEIPAKRRTPPKLAYLRKLIRPRVLKTPDEADTWDRRDPEKQALIAERLQAIVDKIGAERPDYRVTRDEFEALKTAIFDDVLGFGPIDSLIRDTNISEVMVTGNDMVFVESHGRMYESDIVFDDEDHVLWTAQRIVRPMSRNLNREQPMTDARLPDGSRVHLVTEPSAILGTTISIRKFPEKRLTIDDLIRFGSVTSDVAEFLAACVRSRLNVIVSGGTGSGKTTLLNVLSAYIPDEERIVTIEDAAELQLWQRHVVRLETAPPVPGGDGKKGALAVRDLVRGALRMRPDRILVGECRGGEAIDMLQAMNTGHDGSLTTVHSNNPRDCIARLETLCLMAGLDLPVPVIRRQIVSAIDLIVQVSKIRDGSRKIIQITELQGMEGEQVTLQDIFLYRLPGQTAPVASNVGGGKLEALGFRPKFIDKLEENGFRLSGRIFGMGQTKFDR